MHDHRKSKLWDVEVLAAIIGARESTRLYRGSLNELFMCDGAKGRPRRKLCAVKELVKRWLAEQLSYGSVLNSPSSVRDYLRLRLQQLQHEVFLVLFLDARHRLIEVEEL